MAPTSVAHHPYLATPRAALAASIGSALGLSAHRPPQELDHTLTPTRSTAICFQPGPHSERMVAFTPKLVSSWHSLNHVPYRVWASATVCRCGHDGWAELLGTQVWDWSRWVQPRTRYQGDTRTWEVGPGTYRVVFTLHTYDRSRGQRRRGSGAPLHFRVRWADRGWGRPEQTGDRCELC